MVRTDSSWAKNGGVMEVREVWQREYLGHYRVVENNKDKLMVKYSVKRLDC